MPEIDLKPTEAMASNAERGLALREEYGRGGTEVGVARARDIKNRKNLSPETVKRMHSFFSRHEVDKKGKGWKSGSEGYPSAGLIAWLLWGGDSGKSWAERKVNQINGKSDNSMNANNINNRIPLSRAGAKSLNAARLVGTVSKENVAAKIYKNYEWEEFVVKFFVDGVHQKNADSHHDNLEDAKGTARFAVDHYLKNQVKNKNSLGDACWDGYEAVGTKKKDGKTVPNCVPKRGINSRASQSAVDPVAIAVAYDAKRMAAR